MLLFLPAIISGAVLTLVSPPFGYHLLHWFTFIPILSVLDPENPRKNFKLGYATGVSGIFCLFFWLAQTIDLFSNIPLAVAAIVVLLFALVWGLPYGLLMMAVHPIRKRFGEAWILLFPFLWVAVEYLWPSLFPYYQGVGQYRVAWTWQLASVFGPFGLTWLIIAVNSALAAVLGRFVSASTLKPGANAPWAFVGVVAALMAATLGYGKWRFESIDKALSEAPTLQVSILQQDITMVERLAEKKSSTAFKSWVNTTKPILGQPLDLVIWPEGAVPYNPTDPKIAEALGEISKLGNFNFLLGGGTWDPDPKDPNGYIAYNSCYLFGRDGQVKGRYNKMVPLPFGEYLPWPFIYLRGIIRGPGNFQKGTDPHIFEADRRTSDGSLVPFTFTTPICYEAILESMMRKLMDADIFVNITNDGWFGDTAAPHQHAMLAVAYATEFGRPMVRSAYTGISMVVDPHGVIREETTPYTSVSKVATVKMLQIETPYRTWGGWFPAVASLIGLGSIGIALRSPKSTAE